MAKRLTGRNPLAYCGDEPVAPPQTVKADRDPTSEDNRNFNLHTLWLNTTDMDVFMLVRKEANIATWARLGGGGLGNIQTLTGDTGGAVSPDGVGDINLVGTTNRITTTGTPASNLITWDIGATIADQYDTDSGSAVPSANALTVAGSHGLNTSGAASTVTVAIDNTITLGDLSDVAVGSAAITLTTGDLDFLGDINDPLEQRFIVFPGNNRIFFYLNNVFMGAGAGNTTMTAGVALFNIGIGPNSCSSLTIGTQNVAVGNATLEDATTAQDNLMIGFAAGAQITTGSSNVGIGSAAFDGGGGAGLLTGDRNIALGNTAGNAYTAAESDNILINNTGTAAESNVLRIGSGTGTGNFQLNEAFISGIRGITTGVADAIAVLIDSANQLGTVSSSIRVKKNIDDMGHATGGLFDLRPVLFDYIESPSDRRQYGLIAEEVEKVMPDLVVYDKSGDPESVRYHELPVMLLNEMKKMATRIKELEKKLGESQ